MVSRTFDNAYSCCELKFEDVTVHCNLPPVHEPESKQVHWSDYRYVASYSLLLLLLRNRVSIVALLLAVFVFEVTCIPGNTCCRPDSVIFGPTPTGKIQSCSSSATFCPPMGQNPKSWYVQETRVPPAICQFLARHQLVKSKVMRHESLRFAKSNLSMAQN